MGLTLTTAQTLDKFETYYYQRESLKHLSNASPQNIWGKAFGESDGNTNFGFDGISSLYESERRKASTTECEEIPVESNSSTETKEYSKVFTLSAKIEKFKNYGEELFDPDIPVGPNFLVIETAKELVIDLVENNISPFRVAPSIEEGLCLVFQKDNVLAYLELYNDGEIGLIAEDMTTLETLVNCDLEQNDIIAELMDLFQ